MPSVNINKHDATLNLSAYYLWKSTRVQYVTMADSTVVLQQGLREKDGVGIT